MTQGSRKSCLWLLVTAALLFGAVACSRDDSYEAGLKRTVDFHKGWIAGYELGEVTGQRQAKILMKDDLEKVAQNEARKSGTFAHAAYVLGYSEGYSQGYRDGLP